LTAVAALAPNDVWAVGNSTQAEGDPALTLIEHYNGTAWSVVPSPNVGPTSNFQSNLLNGITALSPTDMYAFGAYKAADGSAKEPSLLLHWDGTAWTIVPSPDPAPRKELQDILFAGVSPAPGHLWIVGSEAAPANTTRALAVHSTAAATN
jgi:hypothetical protein